MQCGSIDHHISINLEGKLVRRDVLGQYIPPDQWAHGYMMVNTSMLHNDNEEILSEGGK